MKIERDFEICPHCDASVRSTNFPGHLLKVHGIRSAAETDEEEISVTQSGEDDQLEKIEAILLSEKTFKDYLRMRMGESAPKNEEEAQSESAQSTRLSQSLSFASLQISVEGTQSRVGRKRIR